LTPPRTSWLHLSGGRQKCRLNFLLWGRLHALLQQEMARLSRQPEHTRLFLEFWALGVRDAAIRARISAELER
jgi:hypothetical protein